MNNSFQKKVLILGAGQMQLPAVFETKLFGHYTIVADANEHAIAVPYCDEFWHIDIKDITRLIAAAQDADIDAVLTCATDFSFVVASLAQACNISGISLESAEIANYKHKMREVLARNNICIPRYEVYSLDSDLSQEEQLIQMSRIYREIQNKFFGMKYVVIKPADNMGARGVQILSLEVQCSKNTKLLLETFFFSPSNTILIEEYIEGQEISIDSFIQDGILYPLGIADRHIYFAPYFIEMGHSIPSTLDNVVLKKACKILQDSALAAGITQGICKGDIIIKEDKVYVCEFAARLSGGYMSGWTIPYTYSACSGLNPTQIAIMQSLGKKITIPNNYNFLSLIEVNHTREHALLMLPGHLEEIRVSEFMRKLEQYSDFRNIFFLVEEGKNYHLPKNNTQKAANIIVSGDDEERLRLLIIKIMCNIYFKVSPNGEVNDFLFSPQEVNPYNNWRSYEFHSLEEINNNVLIEFEHVSPMPVYIPEEIKENTALGIWEPCTVNELLQEAIAQQLIVEISESYKAIGGLFWSALLRGGWQGMKYFLEERTQWKQLLKK